MNTKKIVITGSPGTGKSTIINELIKRGHTCFEEISREVTLNAQKEGVEQLFLTNPVLYSERLMKGRLGQFQKANELNSNMVFLDRGVHDVMAYLDFIGSPYPDEFKHICQNSKYDIVFILRPWKAIYTSDNERYESFDEALEIYHCLLKTYQSHHYNLLDVPFDTVENRADYILNTLNRL